uniref:Chorismate lyase n=1 Tax=Renouxia sp. TaxID=2485823 RepID=A0A3G3MHM2_9FLOR|nr:hypothetical protein [Renouxia sp.]
MTLRKHFISFYIINRSNLSKNLHNIPITWRLIIIGQGSFTQNLNSITGEKIYVELVSQKVKINRLNPLTNHTIRRVWIKNKQGNKLAFAESYWNQSDRFFANLTSEQPIGKSLIEFETDFYKEIQQIEYGHSYLLEKAFRTQEPIWSRKYSIWHDSRPIATIREFFSNELIKYLI